MEHKRKELSSPKNLNVFNVFSDTSSALQVCSTANIETKVGQELINSTLTSLIISGLSYLADGFPNEKMKLSAGYSLVAMAEDSVSMLISAGRHETIATELETPGLTHRNGEISLQHTDPKLLKLYSIADAFEAAARKLRNVKRVPLDLIIPIDFIELASQNPIAALANLALVSTYMIDAAEGILKKYPEIAQRNAIEAVLHIYREARRIKPDLEVSPDITALLELFPNDDSLITIHGSVPTVQVGDLLPYSLTQHNISSN